MPELERELRALAAAIDFPPAPELGARVHARLGTTPRRRPLRLLAIAVAVFAVAVGAAFAVPDSRSAILRFFGLKGVTVRLVEKLPPVGPGPVAFGERTTLAAAERELGFRPLRPQLGEPDRVYVDPALGYLILLYGEPRLRLRVSEFRTDGSLVQKLAKFGRGVEALSVNGGPGIWVPGPHAVIELQRQPRLSASALIWEQAGLTVRLEGRLTKAAALELARGVR